VRIDEITLARFGSFTNRVIDFGAADAELDLHVVYGPNEAGKSTLRSAVEYFLYGIPSRTGYNFLHENKSLQIGAKISRGDQVHELTRIKREANSLRGLDSQAVGDDLLNPWLGGVDRESYRNIFSMDEDSLEKGGDSILASEGEIGELLFSSTSGLAALGSELGKIRLEAEAFFKVRGQKVVLKQKTAQLKELREQIKTLDVPASQYAARKKAATDAKHAHGLLVAEREQKEKDKMRLKALLDCITPWREYEMHEAALAAFEPMPVVPVGWMSKAQELATESTRLDTRIEQLQQRIADTRSRAGLIEISQAIIDEAPQIDRLAEDDLEARVRTADSVQSAQALLDSHNDKIQHCIARLSAPRDLAPQQLPLAVSCVARIKLLTERRLVLDSKLQTAADEASRAQLAFDAATKAHSETGSSKDLSELARQTVVIREQDVRTELERRQTEKRAQYSEVQQALLALEPWKGTAAELKALVVPAASSLSALLERENTNLDELRLIGKHEETVKAELGKLQGEYNRQTAEAVLIDDASAIESRDARDTQWRKHQQILATKEADRDARLTSAEQFQSALKRDDALVAERFSQAAQLAQLHSLTTQITSLQAQLEKVGRRAEVAGRAHAEVTAEVRKLCEQLGLPDAVAIAELDGWLKHRTVALREAEKLNFLQAECDELQQTIETVHSQLLAALNAAELSAPGADFRVNLLFAEDAVANWQSLELAATDARRVLDESTQERDLRHTRLADCEAAIEQWHEEWIEALEGTWLATGEQWPGTAVVGEILPILDELVNLLAKADDAKLSLQSNQDRRARYGAEVTRIAATLDTPMDGDNPLATADQLRKQLLAARDELRQKGELEAELADLETQLRHWSEQRDQSQSVFAEMSELFPATNVAALVELMQRAQDRDRTVDSHRAAQRQLLDLLSLKNFDEAQRRLKSRLGNAEAIEALQAEHTLAIADSDDLNEEVSRLFHDWRVAEDALAAIGDDGEVARLNEQVRLLLLDIEAETRQFIALSAGTLAVERALRSYVDNHRGTLLARASSAFATITRGAFTGLEAMPGIAGQSKEELVGLRPDGFTTSATQMSRGSRFQLYLSLRIAGYHEFVAEREPLPFFADDILETFDDDRSAETFALMADMAKHGQVIYLTHHRHLCELAMQATEGRAKLHELPARFLQDSTHA